jgi:hypothetical protein
VGYGPSSRERYDLILLLGLFKIVNEPSFNTQLRSLKAIEIAKSEKRPEEEGDFT